MNLWRLGNLNPSIFIDATDMTTLAVPTPHSILCFTINHYRTKGSDPFKVQVEIESTSQNYITSRILTIKLPAPKDRMGLEPISQDCFIWLAQYPYTTTPKGRWGSNPHFQPSWRLGNSNPSAFLGASEMTTLAVPTPVCLFPSTSTKG